MKYMGSKRSMLLNGLGELLSEQVQGRVRFFDLFCGAGSVASHVAQNFPVKVFACDLQKYATVLVASQIERTTTFLSEKTFIDWTKQAELWIRDHGKLWERASEASIPKGIETQTLKLFEVCRMRNIPIITFINKMYRVGQDPFALMDEIVDKLQMEVVPASWPIGMGRDFRGCYDLINDELVLFDRSKAN